MAEQPVDLLGDMFAKQVALQKEAYGIDLEKLASGMLPHALVNAVKDNMLAIADELHEALGEVGWKPWASKRYMNRDAYLGELVDVMHFFINLYALGGGTAEDLHARYLRKNAKNLARQEAGYDGVKGKCPGCKRALDDEAVTCREYPEACKGIRCSVTGRWYDSPQ